jgi:acetyl-CoA synthetase
MTQTAAFQWNVPPEFNFARDVLDELAKSDRRGLLFVDTAGARHEYTFAQIAEHSQRWAGALRDLGVGHGDHAIVVLPKTPQWLFVMLALLRLGAVAIPGAEQRRR